VKFVGGPIGRLDYGMAFLKSNSGLRDRIDDALRRLEEGGELRALWERWGLWNPLMAAHLKDGRSSRQEPAALQRYLEGRSAAEPWRMKLERYAFKFVPLLAKGAVVTLELSVLGMALAMFLGLALALSRLHGPWSLRWAALGYIELLRGTPLLIQLFILFYGLPHFGVKLPPFAAAVLGLGLNYAAYEAENYRAGLLSLPRHQLEAALALGLKRSQALRHVLLPQALRVILPPATNDFVSILKDSSLVSVITMVELTKVYGQLAATYYDWLGLGLLTAAMYLGVGLPFVWLARSMESRLDVVKAPR